jgi:uncharacterized protein YjiS (DUF1127 family)
MQQIADWLKKLGMSEYINRFVENRIDLSVLPELTDQDLKDLGVLLGDRRKLPRPIRDLGTASVAVTAPTQTSVATILEFPSTRTRTSWVPRRARPCAVDDVEFYSLKLIQHLCNCPLAHFASPPRSR